MKNVLIKEFLQNFSKEDIELYEKLKSDMYSHMQEPVRKIQNQIVRSRVSSHISDDCF